MEGRYANYFEVGHNDGEFVIVFGQFYESEGEPIRHTRVVMGPVYAKELATLLAESIAAYEMVHGPIRKS